MLAALITTVLFSFSALFGRGLANQLSATQANLARLTLAAALLGCWSHLFGFGIGGAGFPVLFLSGCVGFGFGDLAMFQAYPRIGTRRTIVLIQCLAAPFAALAEWAWLGNAPTIAQAGFGLLILAGVCIALLPGREETTSGLGAGICFGVISALCQGGGAVLSRKAYAIATAAGHSLHGVRDGVNAAYQRMLGGIAVSVIFFLWLKLARKPNPCPQTDWRKAWPWVVGAALFGPSLGVPCYQWALMSTPTNIVLPIVATTPLAVLPLVRLLEGERITRRAILGSAIAVAGVIGLSLKS